MEGYDNPIAWSLLLIIPIFIWLFVISIKKFKLFIDSGKITSFLHNSSFPDNIERSIVFFIRMTALFYIIYGLTEPWEMKQSEYKKYENVRIYFLVDVSRSMVYAEDIKPNRLAAVKSELSKLYGELNGYRVSIIPFSGTPNTYYCPLTYNRSVVEPLIYNLGPEVAPTLGTDLTAATKALELVINEEKFEKGINIAIIISDGGKEESEETDRGELDSLVLNLAAKNTKFFTIGVGGKDPTPLIVRDKLGNFVSNIENEDKTTAKSQLDAGILESVAKKGGGEYIQFDAADKMYTFLQKTIDENKIEDGALSNFEKYHWQHWCFTIAAILLFICFMFNRSR